MKIPKANCLLANRTGSSIYKKIIASSLASRAGHVLLALCCLILAAGLFVLAWYPARAQEENSPSWRFGVVESYESPEHAGRLYAGWTRIPFNWAEVQQGGSGSWTPRVSDQQIKSEKAAGRLLVGLLIGIPDWARDENRLPAGLWLAHDHPDNLWANYVREAVSRYQDDIDHWIIWNEPDIAETEIAHTWDGSVADFAQLQRTAYRVAKEANPEAVIHLAAFTFWADYYAGTEQYMAKLLDEILTDPQAAQYNFYFDVATAHLYFQPNQIYDLLNLFTGIMRERDLSQPIWLVETNAPPKDDPAWPVPNWTLSVNQNEQATFMPQAMAVALAAGAERVAVYKLIDTEEDRSANPEPFGLVRLDGSERPAFASYRIAIAYLRDAYRAERERWNEVGQIRVDQPGRTTSVLFARLPQWQQAQVTATDDEAFLVDMWGTKEVITPTNGIYTVDLPPARCSQSIGDYCMIGGPVYYVVQAADVAPPTATPRPKATPTPVATPGPISPTATPAPQLAQGDPIIIRDDAIVDFPETVTFHLELDVEEPIRRATLNYRLGREGCLAAGTQVPVEVSGSSLEWTWVMSRSGNPPPGAQMSWHWELTDAAGKTITTPAKELTFTDERFQWRTIEVNGDGAGSPIRLHWYEGEEVGPILLEAAVAGLERLQRDTGLELQGEVQFFIYADSADMREALLYVQDWAGGIAFTDYNTILIGVPPHLAETWGRSTVRHELAHLVINQFSQSCLGGSLPNWLSEGLAVYAEGEPDEQTLQDIEEGIEGDSFQPVRSLNGSFPAQGEAASDAYSQSYSLVDYLLDTYGQEKMQELLLVLAGAAGYDEALEQVYGFNADGLETAWRREIGAPVRQIPPTPTAILAAHVPTVAPLDVAQSWPTPPAPAEIPATAAPAVAAPDPGRNIGICGLGLVPFLLFMGLATVAITRNSSKKDLE